MSPRGGEKTRSREPARARGLAAARESGSGNFQETARKGGKSPEREGGEGGTVRSVYV